MGHWAAHRNRVREIIHEVCNRRGFLYTDVIGRSRSSVMVDARCEVVRLAKAEGIGVATATRVLGRDPSTAHYYAHGKRRET